MATRVRLHQFSGGRFQPKDVPVVQEGPLTLYVNGQELVTLLCTPSHVDALVVGFLSFEGIIRGLEDIQSLTVLEKEGFAEVHLTSNFVPPRRRGGKLLSVTEDVGRHNGIDKICGEALLRGIPTVGKILLATGRISSEMLRKGAHLGTPIVVSRTSATTLSIDLAKR